MNEDEELVSFKWNNHKTTFFQVLSNLRFKEIYTDVTLACEGKFIAAHKLVLSSCSDYFRNVFEKINCLSPVIILKDIKIRELEALITFIYNGEVAVATNDVPGVIKAAECLQIKGLGVSDELPMVEGEPNSSKLSELLNEKSKKRKREKQATIKLEPKVPEFEPKVPEFEPKIPKLELFVNTEIVKPPKKYQRKTTIPILMKQARIHAKNLNAQSKAKSYTSNGLASLTPTDSNLTNIETSQQGSDSQSQNSEFNDSQENVLTIECTPSTEFFKPDSDDSFDTINDQMNGIPKHKSKSSPPKFSSTNGETSILNENLASNVQKSVEAAKKAFNEHTQIIRDLTINSKLLKTKRNDDLSIASTSSFDQDDELDYSLKLPEFSEDCYNYLHGSVGDDDLKDGRTAVLNELFEHFGKIYAKIENKFTVKRKFFRKMENLLLATYPSITIEKLTPSCRKRGPLGLLLSKFTGRLYRFRSKYRAETSSDMDKKDVANTSSDNESKKADF